MADDYLPPVIARLKLDLGDFDAKLEEAKQKIRDLRKDVRDKITVDLNDTAARAKLDTLTRDRKVNVRVDVDRSALSRLSSLLGGKFSELGALNGGIANLGSRIPNSIGPVPLAAIAAGIPLAGGILTEAAALLSGVTASAAGGGAFYALAHPAINNLQQDIQGLDQANYKLGIAQNMAAADPSKKNLAALTKAQETYNATLKQTQQDSGGAAGKMMQLRAEYLKLTDAFQPEVFKVMNAGLQVLKDLLPNLTPLAKPFADAITGLLNQFDKFTKSSGFKEWFKQFSSLVGPATTAIGHGIGQVAISFGKLLTIFGKKDVVNAINIAFTIVAKTIDALAFGIKRFMQNYDSLTATAKRDGHDVEKSFDSVRHSVASSAHDIAHNFDAIRHAVAIWGHDVASIFDRARHDISALNDYFSHKIDSIIHWFAQMPGRVNSAVGNLGSILVHAGEAAMSGLLSGLESGWAKVAGFVSSIAGKIAHLKGPLDYDRVLLVPHGQAIMDGLMEGLGSRMGALTSQLQGITGTIGGYGAAGIAGGGVNHIVIELDGRQIYSAMQDRAVSTQRRTGHNGMQKRTR